MLAATALGVVAALAVVGLAAYAIGLYNALVRLRLGADQAFANIDVTLQQRHDELAKLVDACRAYMKHERELLDSLTKLRVGYEQAKGVDEKARLENELNAGVAKLRHVWEGYPDLKASANFLQAQGRISTLENTIADRRELFNEAVTQHNIFIAQFPALVLAPLLGGTKRAMLEVPEGAKKDELKPFTSQA